MIQGKTLWLAANAASGSNNNAALAALENALGETGCLLARRIGFHEEGAPSIADLRRDDVHVLVIFAGDGTTNALVTSLYGWDGAILVLPGGTMNILSHRLHGDAEPAAIIAALSAGRARRTRPTVLRTAYGDALSGVLAGPGTAWGEVREAMRSVDVIGTIKGAAEAIGVSAGGAKVVCREPRRGRDEGYSAIQVTPTAQGLSVEAYYAESIADYAKHGVALLRRNFREGPHDDLGCYASVRLACLNGEEMGLLIDGEQSDAAAPEELLTLARCEVDLLATADAE